MIDESCFRKRGKKSAGVKPQYCGTTGRVENCQVGVFLSYVGRKGHTLIDRELYVPKEWIDAPERSREAGIPEGTHFHTKCELACLMVERLWNAHIPFAWVVADSVDGGNLDLRIWLQAHGYSYVLAVACDELRNYLRPCSTMGASSSRSEQRRALHDRLAVLNTSLQSAL